MGKTNHEPNHLDNRLFERMVRPIGGQVLNLQRRNQILRRTRDLLLPRLISREVGLSDIDIAPTVESGAWSHG